MRHRVDTQLQEQARAFDLRFACHDCAHFDERRDVCVHGYVERPSQRDLEKPGQDLAFCKEFELGAGDET